MCLLCQNRLQISSDRSMIKNCIIKIFLKIRKSMYGKDKSRSCISHGEQGGYMLKQYKNYGAKVQAYAENWKKKDRGAQKRVYFLIYTLLFLSMVGFVFWPFFRAGKSFIWIGEASDGWTQHYTALVYYGQWLRDVAEQIFVEHSFSIPTFSFSIGYGSDLFTTLHYYVIGDPLDLLSVFVPSDLTQYLYGGLILLRLYLAGAAFSAFCFYHKEAKPVGVLTGAFVYVFCGFALYAAVRHPYFTNPMIYFPLLLLGAEKFLQEKRPWLFLVMVFVSAVSNFYFFYMIVLLTVLYVLFRLFMLYEKKQMWQAVVTVLQMLGYAIVGVMLSAVILLPVLYLFFGDLRSGSGYVYKIVYPLVYYKKFLPSFISFDTPGSWNFMTYSPVALVSTVLLFLQKKKQKELKIGFLLLTLFLLLPVAGCVFNGFSYVTNRWVWGYSMLVAYIVVTVWDDLLNLTSRQAACLLAVGAVCVGVFMVIKEAATASFAFSLVMMLFMVLVPVVWKANGSPIRRLGMEALLLMLVLCSIWGNASFAYSDRGKNYVTQFKNSSEVLESMEDKDSSAVKALGNEDAFYRYSGTTLYSNSTLYNGMSSTQYFWSLSNGVIGEYFLTMSTVENSAYSYKELDGRTALHALAATRYYITKNVESHERFVPYGYQEIEQDNSEYRIFENQYALPLGYTYDSYLLREDLEGLDGVERQEALLQGILLEEAPVGAYDRGEINPTAQLVEHTIVCDGKGIVMDGNTFTVTQAGASVTLEFQGLEACETYLEITGLSYEGDAAKVPLEICGQTAKGARVVKKLNYYSEYYSWYAGRHDFLANLCYCKSPRTTITITFSKAGTYTFENLAVICQPMENYEAEVTALQEDVLENVDLHNDNRSYSTSRVTGQIDLEEEKLLCLSIPYSAGWRAYVDGKEQTLLQANGMYMALELEAGSHTIELVYETPGLKAGLVISCLGVVAAGALWLLHRGKKKKQITL